MTKEEYIKQQEYIKQLEDRLFYTKLALKTGF